MLQSLADSLFENAPVAFIFFDANLRLRQMNHQAELLFARDRASMLGCPASELGDMAIDETMLRQALAEGVVTRTLPPQADAHRPLEVTCTSITDGAGSGGVLLTAMPVGGGKAAPVPPQAELRLTSEELWAVLDNLSEGVWLIEPDGSPRYRNRAGRHLLGISDDTPDRQITDYGPLDPRYPDGRPVPSEDLPRYRAARGEQGSGMEFYLTGFDGVRRLLRVDTNALRDAQGNVRLGFNLMRDITAQRELELDYKARNEELQTILEKLSDAVFVVEPEGNIHYMNDAARHIMGITPDQHFHNIGQFMHMEAYYPDGRPMPLDQRPFFRSIQGETFSNQEIRLIDLQGVERLVSTSATSILDAQGHVRLGLNVAHDITGQREIESQIAELLIRSEAERQRLFSVIEQMPSGVLIVTAPAGGLYAMNGTARELLHADSVDLNTGSLGYEQLRVFGLDGEEWLPPVRPIARALRGETLIGTQMSVRHADGSSIDLLVNASPLYDSSGAAPLISGAISIFQDISELKELDRLKDDFISITSHELRTPLTTIKGYGQMLTRKLARLDPANPLREELQKPVATIMERTERMIAMINDLLDVSRIATGKFEVLGRALNLVDVVAACIEQARHTWPLPIQLIKPEEPLPVVGEEHLIEQVLNNLLGNAAKYSPAGSSITVKVEGRAGEAIVSVADEGIGIAAEQQEHLFERFYRSARGKNIAPGLGLGLYISAGIIAAHGGRIWVDSEGNGKGATFSFALPLEVEG